MKIVNRYDLFSESNEIAKAKLLIIKCGTLFGNSDWSPQPQPKGGRERYRRRGDIRERADEYNGFKTNRFNTIYVPPNKEISVISFRVLFVPVSLAVTADVVNTGHASSLYYTGMISFRFVLTPFDDDDDDDDNTNNGTENLIPPRRGAPFCSRNI